MLKNLPLPSLQRIAALLLFIASQVFLVAAPSSPGGQCKSPPNLFAELLGKTNAEIDAKIDAAWQQLFYGSDTTERIYYPVDGGTAYMADINNRDVRSEGMSYGLMLAVQLNKKAEFDALWRWTKQYMFHPTGRFAGYFAWHCRYDGTQIDPGPASDGEEWFVMALFFAAHRWGNGEGIFNYAAEAQTILRTMLHKNEGVSSNDSVRPMFDRKEKQIVFVPHGEGSRFTDPSYHLPAFYELWARWAADPADRAFLAEAAKTSRQLFRRAAHPQTGLMPDYSHFDGRPYVRNGHEDFRFDAYRTIANVALDYAWFGRDPWQIEQSNRVLAFIARQGPNCPNLFTLEGKPLSTDFSPGLFAMAAVGALAADTANAKLFVQRLWDMPIPSGQYRYYDGLLYFLALTQVSGHFQIYSPSAP
jgi:oligosaccharide reducing-end xylanase